MEKFSKIKKWLLFAAGAALVFYLTQELIAPVMGNITWQLQIVNVLFFLFASCFFLGITGSSAAALGLVILLFGLFAAANAFVYQFRGSYIMAWDLISIPTAMNVASNYSFKPTPRIGTAAFLLLLLLGAVIFFRKKTGFSLKGPLKRAAAAVLSALLIAGIGFFIQIDWVEQNFDIHDSKFSLEHVTTMNGMMVGFLYKMKYLVFTEPEGYDETAQRALLEETVPEGKLPEVLPDIIVIMNEAFSDLSVDFPLETDSDWMPFTRYLMEEGENTLSGWANVSVYGGKTANTEFEFLTGHTIAFLPDDSIAFQQYVKKPIDAMPRYLSGLGYETTAMHPYLSSGWDRTEAYPLMGFQKMFFLEHFDQSPESLIREYVSDRTMFRQILEDMENRENPDSPVFSFNVTMQNHSPYGTDYDNLPHLVRIKEETLAEDAEEKDVSRLENYLSLIRFSDQAFEELVTELQESERPVIVLMWGDHQPSGNVLDAVRSSEEGIPEQEKMNRYRVPFVIWANYEIEEERGVETSVNYLGNYLLKAAGIPLTRYRTFTEDFSEQYPVLTAIESKDASGTVRPMDREDPEFLPYRRMQYYELADDEDLFP